MPTVFHITHWKSGSQWVRGVFKHLTPDRLVHTKPDMSNVSDEQIRPGAIYSAVYMPTQWFYDQVTDNPDHRFIIVIRDLRDTAISWYFSIKHSHGKVDDKRGDDLINDYRRRFQELSIQDGLALAVEERLDPMANIQLTWLSASDDRHLLLRYEDLIRDEHAAFNRMFDFAEVKADQEARTKAIESESFANRSGRDRGQEDITSHHRKGVSGDWRNYFDDRLKEIFKAKFGQTLIDTGYESDLDW
ncbi:hypothetical protein AY599_16515 [Leptolyngbya valderiana BDU 20041]|nr:hypothetical protein AY599_16515 [Leptolyngbya valderiana BDU 20041]